MDFIRQKGGGVEVFLPWSRTEETPCKLNNFFFFLFFFYRHLGHF